MKKNILNWILVLETLFIHKMHNVNFKMFTVLFKKTKIIKI